MPATTTRPTLPITPPSSRPTTGPLLDTTPAPRAGAGGNLRPGERTTTDLLEPHWVAAIEAATD